MRANINKMDNQSITLDHLNQLMTWFSPSFPVGSFAYSHGLEAAVYKEKVTTAGQLKDWVEIVMLYGSGRSDGVIFKESYIAARDHDESRLKEVAELGTALLPTEELALEICAQGEAFLRSCTEVWPQVNQFTDQLENSTYSVVAAVACASYHIPLTPSLTSWYHAMASSLVSAGVRLIPLGQTAGLQVLKQLGEVIHQACHQALTIDQKDMGSAAPLIEIDSIHHETQYTRLFRS